ncbi:hypothetical protein ACFX12_022093 [Malus domestica]
MSHVIHEIHHDTSAEESVWVRRRRLRGGPDQVHGKVLQVVQRRVDRGLCGVLLLPLCAGFAMIPKKEQEREASRTPIIGLFQRQTFADLSLSLSIVKQQHHQLSDSPELSSLPFPTSKRAMHSFLDSAVVHDGGDSDNGDFHDNWIYWVGPLIGGGLVGLIYGNVFIHSEHTPLVSKY